MATCPSCASEVPQGNRYCGSCGAAIETPTSAPTETSLKSAPRAGSPSTSDQARFIPGTILATRYRIVGLLGRGGMGEVYRADDLKLGQPVALKFLPTEVQRDQARLDRFLNEVRVALKVTHPNVCRVYDIGEVDGQHFISMEYVDGEDLASLLRRIGRLPEDKAVQLARHLCAGMAAAHEEGILHRDLKPANVMIDGRGRAKITDFGLASLAEGIEGDEVRAGTPAYMSPEQHAGKEVTVRSDLYSLGLVLYELFTGKRAFEASAAAEIRRLQDQSAPTTPSSHVEGLDPAVERVILRCLEKEAAARPPSALAIAAALPGTDPLVAALAAGETPSPDLVAASGKQGTLHPAIGASCLVATVLLLVLALVFMARGSLHHFVPPDRHPAALAEQARSVIEQLGYTADATHSAFGLEHDRDYVRWLGEQVDSPARWDVLRHEPAAAGTFWYRQSPRPLASAHPINLVTLNDPPRTEHGMIDVGLDWEGRLLWFNVVPPLRDDSPPVGGNVDWNKLFELAGLDLEALEPIPPTKNPDVYCDEWAAWRGSYPGRPDVPITVLAGAYRGKPHQFSFRAPWSPPETSEAVSFSSVQRASIYLLIAILLLVLGGAILLAVRNLRLGRGDRRGAIRLAVFAGTVSMSILVVSEDYVAGWAAIRVYHWLASSVFAACLAWALYMALEPIVRRRWPTLLVAWTRALSGRFRDPLVGRSILVGLLCGCACALIRAVTPLVYASLGHAPPGPWTHWMTTLLRPGLFLSLLVTSIQTSLVPCMALALLLVLMRTVLRVRWAAVAALALLLAFVLPLTHTLEEPILVGYTMGVLYFTLAVLVIVRFGLLAGFFTSLANDMIALVPLTIDMSAWYAPATITVVLVLLALALYGFLVSLPRRTALARS